MLERAVEQLRHAREQGGAYLIKERLILRVSGSDAFRYLNGQITRDLGRMEPGRSVQACILSPKGKLCAPLQIWQEGDDFLVESSPLLKEVLIARLERYMVADDVTVTIDPQSARRAIHLFGQLAAAEPWAFASGIQLNRLGGCGVDLFEDAPGVLSLPLVDPLIVEYLRIERGIPAWGSELTEEILPPEAGLDRTHIEYDRGCYPGQEVISRLKSIGRVNRILHAVCAQEMAHLTAGQNIVTEDGASAGAITSVTPRIDGEPVRALAYLQRATAESGVPLFAFDPLTGGKTLLSINLFPGS